MNKRVERRTTSTAPDDRARGMGTTFWKIAGAGAAFQAGASAVDSATIIANLVDRLTGNVFAVGAASAVLRLGWLLPQVVVGFLAQRARRRMPFYIVGAFGRATCLALIAGLLTLAVELPVAWTAAGFLALWTLYAFISGIVAVPYNDIVGRSIAPGARSRLLAIRFFGGGVLALGVALLIQRLLVTMDFLAAHALIFALAAGLMVVSALSFVAAGEPPAPRPPSSVPDSFGAFVHDGAAVLRTDRRFRLFLFTQWLGGATLMALPFYVVAANRLGLDAPDVAVLLAAQTAGSLASNAAWGWIGDRFGKLWLLESVGLLRLFPPLAMLLMLMHGVLAEGARLLAFAGLFVAIGALINGMTIGYLGYLMEISPDERRPAYSAFFNVLASPAALLPLLGAIVARLVSLEAVFALAVAAAATQLGLLRKLRTAHEALAEGARV
jgi:MFS family permease